MTLFQRLFQNKHCRHSKSSNHGFREEANSKGVPDVNFDKDKVRLLIVADTEKGRVPYFDSNAINRVSDSHVEQQDKFCRSASKLTALYKLKDALQNHCKTSDIRLEFHRIGGDVKLLEEMMFGAVAMAYKGSTLKVHQIRKGVPDVNFDKDKVRLLIVADTEKGRVPYFDSNAINRVSDSHVEQQDKFCRSASKLTALYKLKDALQNHCKTSDIRLEFHRIGGDVKLLEEMMFGAVAMAYKGSTLKVHQIRSPPQLMVSKIFYPRRAPTAPVRTEVSQRMPFFYSDPSMNSTRSSCQPRPDGVTSIPMDVPFARETVHGSLDDNSRWSVTSSGSFQTIYPSPSNASTNSYNSLHRRWMRSESMSLERCRESRDPASSVENSQVWKKKRCKFGVCVLFNMHSGPTTCEEKNMEHFRAFRSMFFSHIALIERHFGRLCKVVEQAIFASQNMALSIFEAFDQFRDCLNDLYAAPRLQNPVWLSMASASVTHRNIVRERFVQEFMFLAAKYDKKLTKFFVSTLLSAVLTYHLAWVATVAPSDENASPIDLEKHSAKWIHSLAKMHPYNPLWAQLGDLYGATGKPLRLSRTVVVGRKADLVRKFLRTLTYFIRCSDVRELRHPPCLSSALDARCWERCTDLGLAAGQGRATGLRAAVECSQHADRGGADSGGCVVCGSCVPQSCPRGTAAETGDRDREVDSMRTVGGGGGGSCSAGADLGRERCLWTSENGMTDVVTTGCLHQHSPALSCREFSHVSVGGVGDGGPGHCGVGADTLEGECRLVAVKVVEEREVENVQHVQRSAHSSRLSVLDDECHDSDAVTHTPHSSLTSVLSQQLAGDEDGGGCAGSHAAKVEEAKRHFLSKPTSSMFDDYYEDRNAHTMTIDSVCGNHRVVRLPSSSSSHPHCCCSRCPSPPHGCHQVFLDVGNVDSARLHSQASVCCSVGRNTHMALCSTDAHSSACRLMAPPEFDRQRHLSSTSSSDFDPLPHCQVLQMPRTVDVTSCRLLDTSFVSVIPWTTSYLITGLVESLLGLYQLKMSAELCVMYLEDQLQGLYFKSLMLAEYISSVETYSQEELSHTLGFDASDLPLLLAISSTHTPSTAL